jgi:spoIIIJ-associated protein
MEWVETTGRSIEEAKERALDELGVDESEAEFEVIEDARSGLFGRLRSEARVRARVRPTAPRSKEDRRDRRRRTKSAEDRAAGSAVAGASPVGGRPTGSDTVAPRVPAATTVATDASEAGETSGVAAVENRGGSRRRPDRNRPSARREDASSGSAINGNQRGEGTDVEVALDEQGRVAQDFLTKLTAEFGLQADVRMERPDEDTVDLHLEGADLGLLIGQKGATLLAIQDLTRTVVHHQTGAGNGRIHVDVGRYRQKRSEALARFAEQVAATVKESGNRTVLEPMSAADRKVVHDAITGIDGVSTVSEGEDPRRRVVVIPDEH